MSDWNSKPISKAEIAARAGVCQGCEHAVIKVTGFHNGAGAIGGSQRRAVYVDVKCLVTKEDARNPNLLSCSKRVEEKSTE